MEIGLVSSFPVPVPCMELYDVISICVILENGSYCVC